MVQKLWGFKDFNQSLDIQSAIAIGKILPKTAKVCQNLPKDGTLKYHQKLRF
jgi:hypothetical protein